MSTDRDSQRLRFETSTFTIGADACRHVAFDLFAYTFALGLLVAPVQIWNDALEVHIIVARMTVLWCVADRQLLWRTIQNLLLYILAKFSPGCVQIELVTICQCLQSRTMPL